MRIMKKNFYTFYLTAVENSCCSFSYRVQEIKIIDGDFPILTNIIPEGVPHLQHLEVLHIIRSQVVQVRVEAMMQVSSKLRQLSLAHNKLVAVPAAISLLEGLEVLDLRHNAITRLSSMLSRLPRLRTLKLDHNRIRQVMVLGMIEISWKKCLRK